MTIENHPRFAATFANAAEKPLRIDTADLPDTDLARVQGGSATAAFSRDAATKAPRIATSIDAKAEGGWRI